MSNNSQQQPGSTGGGQSAGIPMLNQLLALATEAQGDRPPNPDSSLMSTEDQNWLENALEQVSSDSDPMKKLKRWMQRLQEVGDPTEDNLGNLNDIIEEIGDLVCDMDLAQVFCSLGGLSIIKIFLAKDFDPASTLFVHLVAVLAQFNQKVQKLMVKEGFLEKCLAIVEDGSKSADLRHKSVGAISAIVKSYLPGLIRYLQMDGPDKMMKCFDFGLSVGEKKLVHRCAVACVALNNSFSVEVKNIDPTFRKIAQWPEEMRKKIEDQNAERNEEKYQETLEFLRC